MKKITVIGAIALMLPFAGFSQSFSPDVSRKLGSDLRILDRTEADLKILDGMETTFSILSNDITKTPQEIAIAEERQEAIAKERQKREEAIDIQRKKIFADLIGDSLLFANIFAASAVDIRTSLLSDFEQKRTDKQVGADSDARGTTTLVTKGTAPEILGFAVEHGALTQAVNGNTVTFRGKPASFIGALADWKRPIGSAPTTPMGFRWYNAASFLLSYDVSRGTTGGTFTASQDQLAQWGGRYEFWNHRDPRDPRYVKNWPAIKELTDDANTLLDDLFGDADFQAEWKTLLDQQLINEVPENYVLAFNEFARSKAMTAILQKPTINADALSVKASADSFQAARERIINAALNSVIVALEVTNTRQAPTSAITAGSAAIPLPELFTPKLIIEGSVPWFLGLAQPDVTFNLSGTRFHGEGYDRLNQPGNPRVGAWQDWNAALQFDGKLPKIANLGQPLLSFAGSFLQLREQAVGAKVTVNGTEVDTRGNLWVGQVKLTIPIGDSGLQVPISFSGSNRTEFVTEKTNLTANFGLTFDLDKLFAKGK